MVSMNTRTNQPDLINPVHRLAHQEANLGPVLALSEVSPRNFRRPGVGLSSGRAVDRSENDRAVNRQGFRTNN